MLLRRWPAGPAADTTESPAPRLIGTPRKRTVSAGGVNHGDGRDGAAGGRGATARAWRSGPRPRRSDVAAAQGGGGAAAAARRGLGDGVAVIGRGRGDAQRLAGCLPRRGRGGAGDPPGPRRGVGQRAAEGQARRGDDRARPAARDGRRPGGRAPFGTREAEAVSRAVSPVSGRPYGLAAVCRAWRLARSGVYRHRAPLTATPPRRPGPVGPMPDAALVAAIRAVLAARPFHARGIGRSGPGGGTAASAARGAGCCG